MAFNSAIETLGALIHAYYDERNIEDTLACVTDDIEWVGTENNDSAIGKDELRTLLTYDVEAYPDSFAVEAKEPHIKQLSDDVVVITMEAEQIAEPGKVAGFAIRGTVCCVKTDEGWLISNLHVSVPNSEIEKISLQNELNIEREKQATLLENIPGGVATYRVKTDGRFVIDYASEGLAKLRGFDNSRDMIDIIGADARMFMSTDDLFRINKAVQNSLESGDPICTTIQMSRKNQTPIPLSMDANIVKNASLEEDDLAVFYAVETLLSEDTVRAKKEQDYYRAILNLTNTAFFEVDEDGNFYHSESFKNFRVSRYGLPAIMGDQDASDCFHPDDFEQLKEYLHTVYEEGTSTPTIVRMKLMDGRYQWTELTAHVEKSQGHQHDRMTGILRKVNVEWEKQKESLKKALNDAENANKAKTAFLSRVSHDMRTPLNGILGLTALLKDSITDNSVLRDLGEMEVSGHYLLDLINDTLDISRIESGKLELHPIVYDGRMLFNNALRLANINAKTKNIKLNVSAAGLPFTLLYLDVGRLEQVVLNVVGNAIKFTPEGGHIDITMTHVSIQDGVITDKLVIADSGIGMSKEFLPHIFEAFSQEDTSTTSSSQGTGLGMAITKQILNLMGSDISVESELGQGTTFTIILKLQIATDEQRKNWNELQHIGSGSIDLMDKRILMCEDHPLNTEIAKRLLEAKGVKVEHAENGQVGVEMFRHAAVGYYDAILMDIRMPVMDGIEAAKRIRALTREDARTIPIIAMTANAFAEDIEQTRAAGMNAHLSKPIQPEILYNTLSEILDVNNQIRKQKVLIVDDIEVNRDIIKAFLKDDYEIIEAEDGKQAMELIDASRDIDAVITDIQMPVMDGVELIKKIRSDNTHRHIVILVNTQFGDPEQEEQLLSLGADDFIYKPTTPVIVESRLRNALKR